MEKHYLNCWYWTAITQMSYAVNHGVFNAQFLLSLVSSRMLAILNDCRRVKYCVCFLNVRRVILLTMARSLPNFYFLRWLQDCWRCWLIVGECSVAFVFFNVSANYLCGEFSVLIKEGYMTFVVEICVDVITVSDVITEHPRRWPLNFYVNLLHCYSEWEIKCAFNIYVTRIHRHEYVMAWFIISLLP